MFFCVLLCFLLLPVSFASPVFSSGLDVSVYQGQIDFQALADTVFDSVYIRAGEGGSLVDASLGENQKGAQDYGLDYGFYYYMTATSPLEAEAQAVHFVSLISDFAYTMRPAMDFEVFSGLTVAESNEIALSFLRKVEDLTGIRPALYSDAAQVEGRWSAALSAYPLWVAAYSHLAEPETYTLPSDSPWTDWSGYQYSDSGLVSGIESRVDLDLFGEALYLRGDGSSGQGDDGGEASGFLDYRVQAGDTLWALSKAYHCSVDSIAQANDLASPDWIYVGQVLQIPVVAVYRVVQGDTLSQIAQRFHTTVAVLCHDNDIGNPNLIYVGQVLSLPSS